MAFDTGEEDHGRSDPCVVLRLRPTRRLARADLQRHPTLADLGVLRMPRQTVYALTAVQRDAIEQLLAGD